MDASTRPLTPLVLIFVAACAGGGGGPTASSSTGVMERFTAGERTEDAVHSVIVQAPLDQVAAEVPDVYEFLGLQVGRLAGDGPPTFATPRFQVRGRLYEGERNSEYFNCGSSMSGPRADNYELELVVATRLRTTDGGTRVETVVDARARDRYANTDPVRCRGTGKLEQQISDLLRRRTAGG